MTQRELLNRISVDPKICFGKPCIKGHRIWVSLMLGFLAAGEPVKDILDDYPGTEEADLRACIAYAAEMVRERKKISYRHRKYRKMEWREHIVKDPDIMAGKPVIKGTRLAVEFILDLLAQGWPEEDILRNYPGINSEDIKACLQYASDVLHAEKVHQLEVQR